MDDMEKLQKHYENAKTPGERAEIKAEMDQVPVSSGQLDQVLEREAQRQEEAVEQYSKKHN